MVVLPSEDRVMDLRFTIYDLRLITSVEGRTTSAMPAWFAPRASRFPSPRPFPLYRLSVRTGIGKDAALRRPRPRAAGGTHSPVSPSSPIEAPLNAARTAQRAVPTMLRCRSAKLSAVSGRRTPRIFESAAAGSLSPWERVRVWGIGLPLNTATRTFPATVELCDSSGPYVFSAPTKNWPGARDLSRSNAG